MKVFELTYLQLNALHQKTECSYFKDVDGKVHTGALQLNAKGKYVFGVDKFIDRFPDIDVSKLTQSDYVPPVEIE